MIDHRLIRALHRGLARVAVAERAPQMQAYMKSEMPFLGVQSADLRRTVRSVLGRFDLTDYETWRDTVLELWRSARYREQRYAAIDITEQKRFDNHQSWATLPMYEELIVTGAWWDLVDAIATHRLRRLLEKYPTGMTRRMLAWSRCDDLWKRRAAIICQVRRKQATDLGLLYACIEPNLERRSSQSPGPRGPAAQAADESAKRHDFLARLPADRRFWLRKAIGWALRDYAWTDPEEVRDYVKRYSERLSGLSRREALKNISSPHHS